VNSSGAKPMILLANVSVDHSYQSDVIAQMHAACLFPISGMTIQSSLIGITRLSLESAA